MPADPSGDRAHAVWHYRYPHHPAMGEAVFAAVRKSAFGTKRTYRDDLLIVRFWSRADIGRVRCLLRPTRMTQSGHGRIEIPQCSDPLAVGWLSRIQNN